MDLGLWDQGSRDLGLQDLGSRDLGLRDLGCRDLGLSGFPVQLHVKYSSRIVISSWL